MSARGRGEGSRNLLGHGIVSLACIAFDHALRHFLSQHQQQDAEPSSDCGQIVWMSPKKIRALRVCPACGGRGRFHPEYCVGEHPTNGKTTDFGPHLHWEHKCGYVIMSRVEKTKHQ